MMSFFKPLIENIASRRLILHAGTPKTGTTALQRWLFKQRHWLLEQNILYPGNVSNPMMPKHQWLINALHPKGESHLAQAGQAIGKQLANPRMADIESVLLSTEGLCNHFHDLILSHKDDWVDLTSTCRTTVIITFRDPLQYALSRYCTNLTNPPSQNPFHSTNKSLEDLCNDPNWLQAYDYQKMVDFWEEMVGSDSLICLSYGNDIVERFCRYGLGIKTLPNSHEVEHINERLGELGTKLVRQVNMLDFDHVERASIIHHIKAAEAGVSKNRNRLQHSQHSQQRILSYCSESISRLVVRRPELTPQLAGIAGARIDTKSNDISQIVFSPADSTAFVCCIQPGFLEERLIRLAQSIRLFSGSYSKCSIYAVSPQGEEFCSSTMQILEALDVTLIVQNLNQKLTHFPYANKAYAVEYVQSHYVHDSLIFVDSDTLFVANPIGLHLDTSVDFLARPVDLRNVSSSPLDDLYHDYWKECCQLAGIDISDLPVIMSTVDKQIIYSNWNGGLLMFRADKEVGERWRRIIEKMWSHQLMPKPNSFWGSGQVSFSIAVASLKMKGDSLCRAYNIPLHLRPTDTDLHRIEHPVHIHYHWLLDPGQYETGITLFKKLKLADNAKRFINNLPEYCMKTSKYSGFNAL